jgi:hypothetical protein
VFPVPRSSRRIWSLHLFLGRLMFLSWISILILSYYLRLVFQFRSIHPMTPIPLPDYPSPSSSSCSWRVRRVSCSLILKMKLVPPSLPRSSYVPFLNIHLNIILPFMPGLPIHFFPLRFPTKQFTLKVCVLKHSSHSKSVVTTRITATP